MKKLNNHRKTPFYNNQKTLIIEFITFKTSLRQGLIGHLPKLIYIVFTLSEDIGSLKIAR